MQQPTITHLPKSQVKLTFTVTPEDAKPYLDQAVTDLTTAKPIKGFRPGKATYDDAVRAFGEMHIWETALERIVRAQYVKTVLDEGIETVGSPSVAVDTLVPQQDIVFSVTADVMPHATNLADYDRKIVERKKRQEVADTEVDKAIEELRAMRRTEAVVDRPATKEDMLTIDLVIKKDGVPVEGGTTKNYRVYLNEQNTIPGFAEKLVGAKKGDHLDFSLDFPADHYNKTLAGHPAQFDVTVLDVNELRLPDADDAFAKGVGVESMEKLREVIKQNLQNEADQKADEAAEIELLETLVKESRFSDIPDLLTTEEVRRMLSELERGIMNQGGNMQDYLASIKKTLDDLRIEFIPRALERIKTALVIKEVAKRENVTVNDTEIDAEIDKILAALKPGDTEAREQVSSPEYREYVAVQMKNRMVLGLLKEKGIKQA